MEEIVELDLEQLDGDLYRACQAIERKDYGQAKNKVWTCWGQVRRFRISLDDRHLPATTDRDWWALLNKAVYHLLNLWPLPCRRDYYCHWIYPYGFVPEGGCPHHD